MILDRKAWKAELGPPVPPINWADHQDTHRCVVKVSLERHQHLWRTQTRTYRGEVHEARGSDDPEVPGVDHVATIELEELWSDTRAS